MSKLFLKRKYILILSILIVGVLYFLYSKYWIEIKQFGELTRIFEIKNTQLVYYSQNTKIATIEKYYMIIKPPEDLHKLKLLIEKYDNENPVNMQMVEEKVMSKSNITADEITKKVVYIYFYRESKKLSRDWQPNETYMNTDRMEHHGNDCIASIVYSDSDPQKMYSVTKMSKEENVLIPIEQIEYIGDNVERHEFGKSEN